MTSRIPETDAGLDEELAIQAGTMLRMGWDMLRSLQFNQTASILRYVVTDEGRPDLGIPPTTVLVPGLADLPVYVSRFASRKGLATAGNIEPVEQDYLFIFYVEVYSTDLIMYRGKQHTIVQFRNYDPNSERSAVIARAV